MSDLNVSLSASTPIKKDVNNLSTQTYNKQVTPENQIKNEIKSDNTTVKDSGTEDISSVVDEVNAFVQNLNRNVTFRVDDELGEPIISVMDTETDEVIRQIPSEDLLVLRKKMDDVTGILFDSKA